MKLIQIFALVAALTVTAAAQSTNNQNAGPASPAKPAVKASSGKSAQKGGTGNPTSPVTLTVPRTSQATAGSKNSTPSSSTPAKGTAKNGTSQAAVPKTPVLVVKPARQPATSSKNPATAKTAKTADKTAAKPKVPKKTVVATKNEQARLVPQKVADNKKKPGSGEETIKSGPAGRRDPFLSVIRTAPSGPVGPSCSVGKKCLYIPELVVKGIAKDTEGQMLAVVVSNTHRAYFLRENDQVFNGSVEKITSDSIVFREYATDHLGRETAHEVVKRIPKT
ncbi:MAG TPA: hypothetical protein VI636_01900 [Candidatus Angelobacter sp.]